MAFWPVGDPYTFPPRENEGWGFDALDGFDFTPPEQGGNSDWDNWFAGLDAPPENERRQGRHESTEAHASFDPHRHRSPSPTPGDYAPWLMGYEISSTRDAHSREAGGNNTAVAASSSRPANPPSHARNRQLPPPSTSAPAARHPAANHSNNWLDPLEARRPPRQPYIPDHFRPPPASDSASSVPSAYEGDSDYDNGIDIDDLLNTDVEEEDTDMPPTTRRTQRSVVDLTNDPSSPPPASASTRKRARDDGPAAGDGPSNKRPRRTSIEELDLTNENPSAEEELRQAQAAAAIAAQQSTASDRPLRVGQRTCIICMEPYTNATITSCGHIYCHECLTQALIAGEKSSERGVGNCPVCRKPVNRKKERQMVPVNFMKREAFKGKRAVREMRA